APLTRRQFIGATASLTATGLLASRASAAVPVPYDWNAAPPAEPRDDFIAWMQKYRGEDANFLGQRWDRLQVMRANRDIWDARDIRAYLMTPREEFVTAANLGRAYQTHYLPIGFGVTITGPHTVARMTNSLDVKRGE